MILTDDDLAHWQSWVGRVTRRRERLDAQALKRFAAALDEDRERPSLAHWAFFLPEVPAAELDVDGHRKRGGFLPPISLPRRMFAAAKMRFEAPLVIDVEAEQTATIRSITPKRGKAGDLVLVEVENRLAQEGVDRVVEVQTIIYRDAKGKVSRVTPAQDVARHGDEHWAPSTAELFRFSAVTFNAHRIHYDLPYATAEEGYPALVVHGPLTAARLFGLARRRGEPSGFSFRAVAPLFQGQPILLRESDAQGVFHAVRCDGEIAMTAQAKFD